MASGTDAAIAARGAGHRGRRPPDVLRHWAAGVEMAHHEESQIARQLLAAIPHGTYAECFADPERDPVWQRMWTNRPRVADGMFDVGTAPGFGLVLEAAMIKKYRVS